MKDHIDIIVGIAALIGVIYRVFHIESAIYDEVDKTRQLLNNRINLTEHNLGVHIAVYLERKEQIDYLMHALDEKINHKANRLLDEVKEIKIQLKYKRDEH